MKILRARLKPLGGPTSYETIPNKIKSMIVNYPGDNFDFVIKDGNRSSTKTYGKDFIDDELKGKKLNIAAHRKLSMISSVSSRDDDRTNFYVSFNEDGTLTAEVGTNEVLSFDKFKNI